MFKKVRPQVAINEDGVIWQTNDRYTKEYIDGTYKLLLPCEAGFNADGSVNYTIYIRLPLQWSDRCQNEFLNEDEIRTVKAHIEEASRVLGYSVKFREDVMRLA